jgi:ArsR family transcriptional regulator, arsenate/arsenite/antimonite-responsive transcriptional repressor
MNLERTADCLEALGHSTRLAIYRFLVRAGDNGLAVGDLQTKVDIPLSTLSHHLRKLVQVGLVTQERHGTTLICHANYQTMNKVLNFITEQCCADARKAKVA